MLRVMTRAHGIAVANARSGVVADPTCAGVITRFCRVVSGDADERIVCSLTIWKVFVLTLSFQAKDDDFFLKLGNVAFAM